MVAAATRIYMKGSISPKDALAAAPLVLWEFSNKKAHDKRMLDEMKQESTQRLLLDALLGRLQHTC